MGGTTLLPQSLIPLRSAAADLQSCSSRVRLNPSLMANPAKKPKRPMSVLEGSPKPSAPKRARAACSGDELHVAPAANAKNSKLPTRLHTSVTKNQVAESKPVTGSQEIAPQPQSKPLRELIEDARLTMAAKEEATRRRDIECSRAESRRQLEQMVGTVEFNDPYIDWTDVLKSPQQLLRARQAAWRAQAQLMALARQREIQIANGTQRSVIQ